MGVAPKVGDHLHLTRRYVLALAVIGLFSVLTMVIREVHHMRHVQLVETIELANREIRMAQRIAIIARLATNIERPERRSYAEDELHESIDKLHGYMMMPAHKNVPGYIAKFIQDYIRYADRLIAKPLEQLREDDPTLTSMIAMVESESYNELSNMVAQFGGESMHSLGWLMNMERILLGITLLLLVVEGLLVFRPMVSEVYKAQDYLHQLSRLKSEFLANMSHEIRTPINAIFGISELLMQSEMTVKQRGQVETLMSSADGLLGIIDDILDFSKIEAGRMEIESVAFDLHSAAEDVADLLSVKAREKRLEVIVRYMPGTPQFVLGDPGRIRQILFNLVGNAIKFTEAGYVLITVDTAAVQPADSANIRLRISVEDTGIGIAPDKRDTIFNMFAQADGSTTRRYGGTGLGLTICRQLAELMGGEVGVTSEEGKGSTFWFTIQVTKAERTSHYEPSHSVLADKRILVVDDIEANRSLLEENLQSAGVAVTTVASGKEALRALRRAKDEKRPYELALVDYLMAEMNGDTLVRAIRNDHAIADIPVIVLSSAEEKGFIKIFAAMKVAAYLAKPVRRKQLLDMIAMVLEARARGQQFDMLTTHTSEALRTKATFEKDTRPLEGVRILLTEDNRINREFTTEMLINMGCVVDHAENGRVAVDKCRSQKFDIILMDCQMPVMDGFEAAQNLQAMKSRGEMDDMPIIALTANAMEGDRERCLRAGMHDYLSKPVRKANLESMLLRWLKNIEQAPIASAMPPMVVPAAVPSSDHIDPNAWIETRGLVGDRIDMIANYFLEDGERYVSEIEKALQEGTGPQKFVAPAHTLKSSARQFGLNRLSDLSRQIEETGRQENDMIVACTAVSNLLPALREAFAEATEYIQKQRRS